MRLSTERDKIAHLLRRFGLGASEAELAFYGKNGLAGAIELLLDVDRDEGFDVSIDRFAQQPNGNLPVRVIPIYWMSRMVMTRTPLREKMTLFWHDHFATSGQKVDSGMAMVNHIDVLRKNGLGRFEDLLLNVAKDPAMLYWLDNQLNQVGKPNENFARELLELFTLSIGHYTEKDVQEIARAFTGWGYGRGVRQLTAIPRQGAVFVFNPRNHDRGQKELLGNMGPFNGEDVVGILVGHPETARTLVTKMWSFFAYEKPEKALIDRLVERYRREGLDTKGLVRQIMEAPEFYSDRAARKLYKNPVDFCVATLRQLGLGPVLRNQLAGDAPVARAAPPVVAATRALKGMGMELFFPPDVDGWQWGESWVSTATMVERMKWADRLFGPPSAGQISIRYPADQLLEPGMTPGAFARFLVSIFDVDFTAEKIRKLEQAADKAAAGNLQRNASATALAVTRLIFASPEFQFC